MTRLAWDLQRERAFRQGVSYGVLYPHTNVGVAWNGLVSVSEASEGADITIGYVDGIPYYQERASEGFQATVEAFTYPDEMDLTPPFGFSYRVEQEDSYELHLVYNAAFLPDVKDRSSLDESIQLTNFRWTLSTLPIQIPDVKATSHIVIESGSTYSVILSLIEDLLYGSDTVDSRLPSPSEVIDIFEQNALFRIIDNGDGTWTAIGPESWIQMLDATTFQITSPSAIFLDADTYKISSW